MKDIQLYEQILGLKKPWLVETITLNREEGVIEVRVASEEEIWCCSRCGVRAYIHGYDERRWRHLDSCQYKTVIVARIPRLKCPDHGTETVQVPWAEGSSRFTTWFERLAIDVMQDCSIEGARGILRVSWDEADGIKQRAVKRGLAARRTAPPRRVCVDEKSAGRRHDYVTIVARIEPGRAATVEYVGDDRKQESLDAYWATLTEADRAHIEAVGMDMWEPYLISTRKAIPDADGKIVHDPFHLVSHMNKAVNEVRKQEHRELMEEDDERLKGSKMLWLYGKENLPEALAERFEDMKNDTLKTARAWAIKELFRDFWHCDTSDHARIFFAKWYQWAIRSKLPPVRKVARMIKRHLEQVLTFFTHRLTNGPIEGLNNKIQGIVKKAFGFRNRARFKTDILFHCGGLNLHPTITQ